MTLILSILAASALAQSEVPPPPAPLPANEPYVNAVPDDEVPWEDKAAPEFPRVVRRGDEICMQSFGLDGQIVSQCRPGRFAKPPAQPAERADGPHLAGALGGMAGLTIIPGQAGLTGGAGATGLIGARFTEWLGAVLIFNFWSGFYPGVGLNVLSLAPGIRIGGDRVSFSLCLGPSIAFLSSDRGLEVGWLGTLLGTGVFRVIGPFSLFAQAGASIESSGVILNLGGGAGLSF